MLSRLLAGLAAALLVASPLAAQSVKPRPVPPPPIRVMPPAPPAPPAPALPQEMLDDYRSFCGEEHRSVALPEAGGVRATFVAGQGDVDLLALCLDRIAAAQALAVDRLDNALILLAYRPLEPFWPQMEAEWGSDLASLREELAERARTRSDSGWGLHMAGFVNRAVARVGSLRDLGYFDEAFAVLDEADQRLSALAGDRRREDLDFERTLLAAYRAGTITSIEGDAAAAAVMGRFLETFPRDSEHYMNPLINYAAYLAEAGDNARSLQLIDPAYEEFRGAGYNPETYQIGGSDREFAWIIACDHWRLGQQADARRYVDIVTHADERPRDEYFAYVKPSSAIERRMYRCMDNAEGFFTQYADGSLPAINTGWLLLQPHWGGDNGPLPGWAVPAEVADLFERRYCVLPDSYVPAMRRWGADRSGR